MDEMIEGAYRPDLIIGILKNIEIQMSKAKRKRTYNYKIVQLYILARTHKAGTGSCIYQCEKLDIDPYGFTFFK